MKKLYTTGEQNKMQCLPVINGINPDRIKRIKNTSYTNVIDKNFDRLSYLIEEMNDLMGKMFEAINDVNKRYEMLADDVYRIAPELDLIASISDDDVERDMLADLYMNHNPSYSHDFKKYKEIVSEELKQERQFNPYAEYSDISENALNRFHAEVEKEEQ